MNIRKAFTIIEILIVVAIVATLAGLSFSIAKTSISSAKESSATENLRQWFLAVELYRSDHDTNWALGGSSYSGLGYPPSEWVYLGTQPKPSLVSPCGKHNPNLANSPWSIDYFANWEHIRLDRQLLVYGQNHFMFYDNNCNPASVIVENPYDIKKSIAVLLSGQIVKRKQSGSTHDPGFYALPEP